MSVAKIQDGQLLDSVANTTEAAKTNASNSSMDKEAFLQLLVAQMKYQDPMEPTSNTEYVAQYATFSQVEQLQNMSSTMDSSAAMQLVGKYVTMDVATGDGGTTQVSGYVNYVERSGSKTLLYIDGTPYNYDNLNTVWDSNYLDAYNLSGEWTKAVNELPNPEDLTLGHAESIGRLRAAYDSMTDYQRSYIGSGVVETLKAAEARIKVLQAIADEDKDSSKVEKTQTDDKAEKTADSKETDSNKDSGKAAADERIIEDGSV